MLRPAPSVIALTEADARELAAVRAATKAAATAAVAELRHANPSATAQGARGPTADQRIGLAPDAGPK